MLYLDKRNLVLKLQVCFLLKLQKVSTLKTQVRIYSKICIDSEIAKIEANKQTPYLQKFEKVFFDFIL